MSVVNLQVTFALLLLKIRLGRKQANVPRGNEVRFGANGNAFTMDILDGPFNSTVAVGGNWRCIGKTSHGDVKVAVDGPDEVVKEGGQTGRRASINDNGCTRERTRRTIGKIEGSGDGVEVDPDVGRWGIR